jgi:hypothetical protein
MVTAALFSVIICAASIRACGLFGFRPSGECESAPRLSYEDKKKMASSSSPQGALERFGSLPLKIKIPALLAAFVVVLLGGTALLNLFNYSVGTRTGVVGKLSHKGIACWTTEGQLALPNFGNSGSSRQGAQGVDNTFSFSVPDHEIQKQMDALPDGAAVALDYHQKLFALDWPIPFFCRRRTEYEIVGVRLAPGFQQNAPFRP